MVKATQRRKLLFLAAVMTSFSVLGVFIVYLGRTDVVTVPAAILMLVALVGIYFGLGILIAAHLMVKKLE
jgi:hypothetical protein